MPGLKSLRFPAVMRSGAGIISDNRRCTLPENLRILLMQSALISAEKSIFDSSEIRADCRWTSARVLK